jgi:hypothetical protein
VVLSQLLITAVEGNEQNYSDCKKNYPHINFIHKDVDTTEWLFDDHYDIIIHWGLLYHLKYPKESVQMCLQHCDCLLLESQIIDIKGLFYRQFKEKDGTDQGLHKIGTHVSTSTVESWFPNGMYSRRYSTRSLNSKYQAFYDWIEYGTGYIGRRFWVIYPKIQKGAEILFDCFSTEHMSQYEYI